MDMLAKRIIPCLDFKDGRVVKGVNFVELRDAGDPVEQATIYSNERADELVFLDIAASHEGRDIVTDMVRRVADAVTIPFTVGGGLRTVEDLRAILLAGADKTSINSAAVRTPDLIDEGAKRFGSQCIVVAIDVKREEDGHWQVYISGGRQPTGRDALGGPGGGGPRRRESCSPAWTAMGPRTAMTWRSPRAVADAISIPVVASGGAGTLEHFYDVLTEGRASAALAASLFHFQQYSVGEVKATSASAGCRCGHERDRNGPRSAERPSLGRAGPRACRHPGRRQRPSADGGLHEPGIAGPQPAGGRGVAVEPQPPDPVAQGGDLGERAAHPGDPRGLRRGHPPGAGGSRRPRLPHRRRELLLPHVACVGGNRVSETIRAVCATIADRRAHPGRVLHRVAFRRRPGRRSSRRSARRPSKWWWPVRCRTTSGVLAETADLVYHLLVLAERGLAWET